MKHNTFWSLFMYR